MPIKIKFKYFETFSTGLYILLHFGGNSIINVYIEYIYLFNSIYFNCDYNCATVKENKIDNRKQ